MNTLPTYQLTHWRGSGGPTRGWGSLGSHLGERRELELVLQRSSQKADAEFLPKADFARSLADKRWLSQWSTDKV